MPSKRLGKRKVDTSVKTPKKLQRIDEVLTMVPIGDKGKEVPLCETCIDEIDISEDESKEVWKQFWRKYLFNDMAECRRRHNRWRRLGGDNGGD